MEIFNYITHLPANVLFSYISGIIALILIMITFHFKDRKKVLTFTILYNIFVVLQFYLVGLWDAGTTNLIFIVFVVYCHFDAQKALKNNIQIETFSKKRVAVLLLFVFAYFVETIILWNGPYTLLQFVAIVMGIFSLWQPNLTVYRVLSLISNIMWSLYNIHYQVPFALVANIFAISSVALAIYSIDLKGKFHLLSPKIQKDFNKEIQKIDEVILDKKLDKKKASE